MPPDDLVFYVKLFVKPDRVDEWKAAVTQIIEEMSKEDAFVSCHLHQDASDENHFRACQVLTDLSDGRGVG